MSERKRYVITKSYYSWHDSDTEAIAVANEQAAYERGEQDNQCKITSIVEAPFASLNVREIVF